MAADGAEVAAEAVQGAEVVEYVDWRLIFFINAPIGLFGAVEAYFLLPRTPPSGQRPFDWWGFGTIGFGLFALLLAFSKAQDWHWGSYRILILLTAGVLALTLFVVIELELDEPLIQLTGLVLLPEALVIVVLMPIASGPASERSATDWPSLRS